jgi:hypothetical protein
MKINVHVGVHKTATTYIQNFYKAQMPALIAQGVGYVPLGRLRNRFTRSLMGFSASNFDAARQFAMLVPDGSRFDRLILSDENFIGHCGGFLNSGKLYNGAGTRLSHLRDLLEGHEVTLFLAIRSYDTFIASAYCEGLRNNGRFIPFDEFRQRIDFDQIRWPRVLARFTEALRPAKTRLWRYEDFGSNSRAVLGDLAFEADLKDVEDATGAARPSFSEVAVGILEVVAERFGPDISSQLIAPITDNLPKNQHRPAFQPWDPKQREDLRGAYEQDCASIGRDSWLIAPPIAKPARVA